MLLKFSDVIERTELPQTLNNYALFRHNNRKYSNIALTEACMNSMYHKYIRLDGNWGHLVSLPPLNFGGALAFLSKQLELICPRTAPPMNGANLSYLVHPR